jgi:cbb3-type cytochrome oxidase subunit 3
MSKIVKQLLENVSWLDELSSIMTVFFVLIFTILVIQVLRLKKEKVDEFKQIPFSDDDTDELKPQ